MKLKVKYRERGKKDCRNWRQPQEKTSGSAKGKFQPQGQVRNTKYQLWRLQWYFISTACGHLKCFPLCGALKTPQWRVKVCFTSSFDPQPCCWGCDGKPGLVLTLEWFLWYDSLPDRNAVFPSRSPHSPLLAACKELTTHVSDLRVAQGH